MKLLLSIRPEYVEKILSGTKKFEYRHQLATKPIKSILLYATHPIMQVVGEVEIEGTKTSTPTILWEETKKVSGISRKKYREYFRGYRIAHAYVLGEVLKFDTPKKLSDFGVSHAPQSYAYISFLTDERDNACSSIPST